MASVVAAPPQASAFAVDRAETHRFQLKKARFNRKSLASIEKGLRKDANG